MKFILSVQEVLTQLLYKMSQDFLDIQYPDKYYCTVFLKNVRKICKVKFSKQNLRKKFKFSNNRQKSTSRTEQTLIPTTIYLSINISIYSSINSNIYPPATRVLFLNMA